MAGPRQEGEVTLFEIPSSPVRVIGSLPKEDVIEQIRQVKLININGIFPYLYSQISLEEVPVDKLQPCAKYVLRGHLEIQAALRKALRLVGVDPLKLRGDRTLVRYEWGGQEKVIVPPIVEVSADDKEELVVTDGLHRISTAIAAEETTVNALVIRNTAVPLAVMPVSWDEVEIVDQVPSLEKKRKLRFEEAGQALMWFGLNSENLGRVVAGIPDSKGFGYKLFFRGFDFDNLGQEENKFLYSFEQCVERYSVAGVLVTNLTNNKVLLGSHPVPRDIHGRVGDVLWGNFGGSRGPGERDPRATAARELNEEAGLEINPYKSLRDPLVIIDNSRGGRDPKVVFVYRLAIDENTPINLPTGGEISDAKWFGWGGVVELMDEHRPDLRLWGGKIMADLLYIWLDTHKSTTDDVTGMYQNNFAYLGSSPYEQIKARERLALTPSTF